MAKIDLNKATRDELTALPGVGPAAADAIVKYRKERGGFGRVEELAEVPGIGAQTLDGLRGRVSFRGKGNGAAKSAARAEKKPAEARPVAAKATEASVSASERGVRAGEETAQRTGEAAAEAGKAGAEALESVSEKGAEASRSAREGAARAAEEIAAQGGSAAEAAAPSGEGMLAGLQDIHREWLAYLQEQTRDNVDTGRALASCRSPQELVELQARYARSSWNRFASESTRLANLTWRVVGAGMQPLEARSRQSAAEAPRRARP